PQLKQTKSEIRKLAAEVAELAHSGLPPSEFYAAFLSRISQAMGATGAAIWSLGNADGPPLKLRANHALPLELILDSHETTANATDSAFGSEEAASSRQSPDNHRLILQCVAREQQPILIPPRTVTVEADRPSNPVDEALVIVPVMLEDQVEYLLEVVQRACGGPAAQRGYLRFVAQMADLLADFERRQLLRLYAESQHRIEETQNWLLDAVATKESSAKYKVLVDGLCDSLSMQQVALLQQPVWPAKNPKVLALSRVHEFDPKSEIIEAFRCFNSSTDISQDAEQNQHQLFWFVASERREKTQADLPDFEPESPAASRRPKLSPSQQSHVDRICDLFSCRSFYLARLHNSAQIDILLTADEKTTSTQLRSPEELEIETDRGQKLLQAAGTILHHQGGSISRRLANRKRGTIRYSTAIFCALALAVVAFIPVPLQIRVDAVLRPVNKYEYYAPMQSYVESVHVVDGSFVEDQQPLLSLRSRQLETQIESLLGTRRSTQDRIAELENRRSRDSEIELAEQDRIEAELAQLRIESATLDQQLLLLNETQKSLEITALGAGKVSTWDLSNRLRNRPVETGKALLSTYDPDGPWQLELAIPNNRVGLVMATMKTHKQGAAVRFSLVSDPEQTLEARLEKLASQVVPRNMEDYVLHGHASFDAAELPIRKDGSIANAVIDCGRTPAAWLVIRDAYWAVRSQIQLYW
ncbi:MAG: efflux RND transporter periplasmic adaptor subunit, partial [Planctomycetota bacterium]